MPDRNIKKELSNYRLEMAIDTLKNAELCFDNGFYRDCINRSYYAAFYAMKAVLACGEIDFKRHKDVVAYFNKTYVATEVFPREMGKKLGQLKRLREESDYDDFFIASKEDAKDQLEAIKEFIPQIEEYLKQLA